MKKIFVLLACTTLFAGGRLKESSTLSRISISHREYKGVGYETGYSSGGLFLAPVWRHEFLPFLDARAHVLNDGRFAFNGGVGLRIPFDAFIAGGNFFYDYRGSENFNPQQLGGGLEFLHNRFDVRINGYGPIADTDYFKRSPVTFQGNGATFKEMAEAALPVIDGEVGAPFTKRCNNLFLYGAMGPYYLFGRDVHSFNLGGSWGARARLSLTLSKFLQLEASCTYDKIFHTRAQGMVALHFPLGPRNLRSGNDVLCDAITQPIIRNEIIPIQDPERELPFLHPVTGEPAFFHFVGKELSLVQAVSISKPGDIFLLSYDKPYQGDVTLKENQLLYSRCVPVISNEMAIPTPESNVMPTIAGNVTLGNGSQIVGMRVEGHIQSDHVALIALCESDVIARNPLLLEMLYSKGDVQLRVDGNAHSNLLIKESQCSVDAHITDQGKLLINALGGGGELKLRSDDQAQVQALVDKNWITHKEQLGGSEITIEDK